MEAKYQWKNSLLTSNKNDFLPYHQIKWLNPYAEEDYFLQRSILINDLTDKPLFKSTKPYLNHISKGCQICGEGKWSCLFITNKCNASCFYCPAPQKQDEIPSTQGLNFDNPYDYANYINYFGFTGVSFSGGEPLLYFNRTLEYLRVLRKECSPDLYIWLYTNGILADKQKLQALANENLNEIRFDIGATGFSLDNVKTAKGIIPVITIEIPCIPEEKDRVISMLPQMKDAGVNNLNLHHLRLTQHNARNLIGRDYTIISAERPIILESEIAALTIINEAKKIQISIGINYCSFHYKNRFQKAGYRRMILQKLFPDSQITENGYLRIYDNNSITYKTIKLLKSESNFTNDSTLDINGTKYTYQLISLFTKNHLSVINLKEINNMIKDEPLTPPEDVFLFKIWQFEYIENGLRDY